MTGQEGWINHRPDEPADDRDHREGHGRGSTDTQLGERDAEMARDKPYGSKQKDADRQRCEQGASHHERLVRLTGQIRHDCCRHSQGSDGFNESRRAEDGGHNSNRMRCPDVRGDHDKETAEHSEQKVVPDEKHRGPVEPVLSKGNDGAFNDDERRVSATRHRFTSPLIAFANGGIFTRTSPQGHLSKRRCRVRDPLATTVRGLFFMRPTCSIRRDGNGKNSSISSANELPRSPES